MLVLIEFSIKYQIDPTNFNLQMLNMLFNLYHALPNNYGVFRRGKENQEFCQPWLLCY
jgi:hypothetical protein